MKKFDDFITESLLQKIDESIVYFSPKLRNFFQRMDDPVATELLNAEGSDIKDDITLINFTDNSPEGFLSFITMKNVKKFMDDKQASHIANRLDSDFYNTPNAKNIADDIYNLTIRNDNFKTHIGWNSWMDQDGSNPYKDRRIPVKVGKLINKIIPGKFTDKQVEDFVNKFKSSVPKVGESFLIVEGPDIAKWYHYSNYFRISGNLGSSCMREKPASFFDIYVKNPEVCRMLCLLETGEDGVTKLKGRALIWKLFSISWDGPSVEYFMDRQYTTADSDVNKFRDYAKKEGWAYKTYNNHTSLSQVSFDGNEYYAEMVVKIKRETHQHYPYMDTLARLNRRTGKLFNDVKNDESAKGCILLRRTTGDFNRVS